MRRAASVLLLLLASLRAQEPDFSWQLQGEHASELEVVLQSSLPLDATSPRAVVAWWLGVCAAEVRERATLRARLHALLHAAMQPWYERCFLPPFPGPQPGLQAAALDGRDELLPGRVGDFEAVGALLQVEIERSHVRWQGDGTLIAQGDERLRLQLRAGQGGTWQISDVQRAVPSRSPGQPATWRPWSPPADPGAAAYPPEPAPPADGALPRARFLLLELLPFRLAVARHLRARVQHALRAQLARVMQLDAQPDPTAPEACEVEHWQESAPEAGSVRVDADLLDGRKLRFEFAVDGRLQSCGQLTNGRYRILPFARLLR